MSQTAKKILEALEHFSSPVSDAKKIPLKNTNNAVSSIMSRKRAREEIANPSAKIGLRHLTRELTVPTVPDILKLRRRQKLQDTTLMARKIVSARSDPPPPPQEYRLRYVYQIQLCKFASIHIFQKYLNLLFLGLRILTVKSIAANSRANLK